MTLEETIRKEGDYKAFEYKGYKCRIIRPHKREIIHLCGYVGLPSGHKYFGEDYDNIGVEVHGGLTYSSQRLHMQPEDDLWWIGFDCGHYGDISFLKDDLHFPGDTYKDMNFVESEIKQLVDQLIKEETV